MTLFGVSLTDRYDRRDLFLMGLLAALYLTTSQIAFSILSAPAVIMPAGAISLAFLVLYGTKLWPAIAASAALTYLIIDVPPLIALFIALGHTLHAVVGAYLLQLLAFDPVFRRIRDMLSFMLVIVIVSALVPLFGLTGLTLQSLITGSGVPVTFGAWWMGIFLLDLILGALIIRWRAKPAFTRTRTERIELAIALSFVVIISYILFWTDTSRFGSGLAILFYLAPFLWFVLRLGMRFTLLAFAISTLIGITGILYGYLPVGETRGYRLLVSEFFLAAVATIFYLFVAVVEERQRASRDLNAQLERVKALLLKVRSEDRAKSEFLAIFSHELRNPLAPVVSSLELLQLRGVPDPETKRIIDVIDERVHIIVRLLDDLLDISRISRKTFRLKREHMELQSVVRQSIRSVIALLEGRNQTLETHIPQEPVYIDADPVRIEQVLMNILNNAVKYTPPGGHISVTIDIDTKRFVCISIKDTGMGIPPHMLKRIFEPFLQIEKDPKERVAQGGLGIGLSLTEKLVVMHGGTIEARSDGVGTGSEFVVRLPMSDRPVPVGAPDEEIARASTRMRILIIDDNEAAALALGEILEMRGHTVEYTMSGVEGVQKAHEHPYDAIILDIGLPDMDGYTAARILREEEQFEGLLIAITGYGQEEDRLRAMSVGFDHHLTKPVNATDVEKALRRSRIR